jgi:galactose mutarotase-like enzyme
MIHTIKNNKLQLSVKQIGAEICSIKSIHSKKEYIWDAKPDIWGNHAPILFPIVGALKDGKYKYKGIEYALPQHGFMRFNKHVEMIDQTDNYLAFSLKENEETLKVYPFKFAFFTSYFLEEYTICIKHQVHNTGNETLLFSVGTHPAFKCPINENEQYEDYYLEFKKEENSVSHCIENGLIGKQTKEVFENNINSMSGSKVKSNINMHPQLFSDNALVFKDLKSTSISLKSKKSDQSVKISFKGFPYMGIWAKPNAQFVCIEPWLGIADSVDSDQNLENKEGIIKLEPNKWFNAKYYIEIIE